MPEHVPDRDGVCRLDDGKVTVEAVTSEYGISEGNLCIRRSMDRTALEADGSLEKGAVEGNLATIPEREGRAVMEALADYYGFEVSDR